MSKQPVPDHVAGTPKGEEQALNSREPGAIRIARIIATRAILLASTLTNGSRSCR